MKEEAQKQFAQTVEGRPKYPLSHLVIDRYTARNDARTQTRKSEMAHQVWASKVRTEGSEGKVHTTSLQGLCLS